MTTQAAVSGHEAAHSGPSYIAVFIYLAILTAIELVVYAAGLPQVAKVGLLVALAWAKAVLVAMYFMHLAMERKALAIVALTPVILVTFLCFMLLPDLTTRMWTRYDHPRPVTSAEMSANPVAPPPMQTP
ncbi:MAG TPA: cytochrome C oxidase subunit IV family protein [Patescibacteria group bacterium]|nr:cytochrome C oxidase subunit IV family protein [Patescibacteria group bacterium]